jgi:hypothetical protein
MSAVPKDVAALNEACSRVFSSGDYAGQETFLKALADEDKHLLLPHMSGWFTTAKDGKSFELALKVFLPLLDKDQIKSLSRRLLDESVSIRLAVLTGLIVRAPTSLAGYLPRLLTANDLRLRSLAIKGLAQIDQDEAIAHIDLLLNGNTGEEKLAGLQSAFLLPFEAVKGSILRFVAMESDQGLLEKAGMMFAANPDPEVPFRLYRLTEGVGPEKAVLLKKMIKSACQAVESSRVLGDRYPEFMQNLQNWILKFQATRFAQECVEQFSTGEESEMPGLTAAIRKKLEKPLFREVFLQALQWPLDDSVKERIHSLLGLDSAPSTPVAPAPSAISATPEGPATPRETSASVPVPVSLPVPAEAEKKIRAADYDTADLDSRIRFLAALSEADVEQGKTVIAALMKAQRSEPSELAAGFRAAVRLHLKTFKDRAQVCVRSSTPVLANGALEYLAAFFPDLAFTFLGMFLNSTNLRSKSTAVRILKNSDPKQALATIETLLQSEQTDQQKLALACVVHFDFSLIRPILLAFLAKIPEPQAIQSALCLFQANPDPEALYGLFRLEQILPGDLGKSVLSVRRKIEEDLDKLGLITGNTDIREEAFSKRWKEEKRKEEGPPPEYSVKSLKAKGALPASSAINQVVDTSAHLAGGVISLLLRLLPWVLGIGFVVGVFLMYGYLRTLFGTESERVAIGVPVGITGQVQGVATSSGNLMVKTLTMGSFEVQPDASGFAGLAPGDEFKAVVIPIKNQFGTFIVERQATTSGP